MSCLTFVILSYLFYGDSIIVKALFHDFVFRSIFVYYMFLNLFAAWSLITYFVIFTEKKLFSCRKEVIDVRSL